MEINCDCLGLTSLLGADARVGARRIYERYDGNAELLGELHLGHCLAITLGIRASEIAGDLLLGGPALVLADDQYSLAADMAQACDDCAVVAEASVSVQFAKILNHQVKIIREQGPLRVARNLDSLPGRKFRIDTFQFRDLPLLELANLGRVVDSFYGTELAQLIHLAIKVSHLLLEIEVVTIGQTAIVGHISYSLISFCHKTITRAFNHQGEMSLNAQILTF